MGRFENDGSSGDKDVTYESYDERISAVGDVELVRRSPNLPLSSSLLPRFVLAGPLFALGFSSRCCQGRCVRKIARDRGGNFESVNIGDFASSPRGRS